MELVCDKLSHLPTVASALLPHIKAHKILLINAPMGAGKTTLVNELCLQLGVSGDTSSPTYSLVNEYETTDGETLYHFDFYRLKSEAEAYDMGAEDYFFSKCICLIEWPDVVRNLLPDSYLELNIEVKNEVRHYQLSIYE